MATSCSPTCQQYPLVPVSAGFHMMGRGAAVDGQINFVNTAASRRPSDNVKGKDFMFINSNTEDGHWLFTVAVTSNFEGKRGKKRNY